MPVVKLKVKRMASITRNDDPRARDEEISLRQKLHKRKASENERKINEHIKGGREKFQH